MFLSFFSNYLFDYKYYFYVQLKDNIATNIGIWDGASATAYKNQWESLSEKIPSYITTFEEQAISLSEYSKKMKSTEN